MVAWAGRIGILLGTALVASACVPVHVTTEVAPGSDFTRYSSYAQAPPPVPPPGAEGSQREARAARTASIRATIDTTLQEKGYFPASPDEADLIVGFSFGGESVVRLVNASDPDTDYEVPQQFEQGTLVLTVTDRRDGRRLWRRSKFSRILSPRWGASIPRMENY